MTQVLDVIYEKETEVEANNEIFGLTSTEFNEFVTFCRMINTPYLRLKLTEEEQTTIEEYKLIFMKKMRRYLQDNYDSEKTTSVGKNQEELREELLKIKSQQAVIQRQLLSGTDIVLEAKLERITDQEKTLNQNVQNGSIQNASWYSWPAFYFLILVDFAPMIISGVLYAGEALNFLPIQLPIILATMIGLWLNVTELTLAYAFIAPILKQRLGITSDSQKCLPALCVEQVEEVNKINNILSYVNIVNNMSYEEYKEYSRIGHAFNQSIVDRSKFSPEYNESIISQTTRYVMTGINLAHNAAGVLFMSRSFLAMVAPTAEILSPLGISIIAFMLAGQLAARYIYRASSLFVMMNPSALEYDKAKMQLTSFKQRKKSDFQDVLNEKMKLVELEETVQSVAHVKTVQAASSSDSNRFFNSNSHPVVSWKSNVLDEKGFSLELG